MPQRLIRNIIAGHSLRMEERKKKAAAAAERRVQLTMDAGALENRRRLLADRAFATPEGTAALTAITQPEIYHRLDLAMAEARQAGEKLFFVDGAVIVGTPFQKRCSHLVLVAAPYETSVQRICARDGIAPEMARRRLDAQLPENVLRAAADFVIENDGTLQQMQQRCNALLTALRKEAYGETSDEK